MIERTLVICKPDAVQRGLMGRILTRFEEKGLKVVGTRFTQLPPATVEKHYEPHKDKPFYAGLVQFMTQGPVLLLCLEGPSAIQLVRNLMGATFGTEAAPGTIRALYAESKERNAIHASDSAENAAREVAFFFAEADFLGS